MKKGQLLLNCRQTQLFRGGGNLFPHGWGRLFAVALMLCCFTGAFAQLSGTKTINPSGSGANNYTTFTAAVADLVSKGVNGAVVFNVSAGTYTEQINIPSIAGASATNTITFKSANGDSTSANLQFATTSGANYVVLLQNADHIIFRNITVQSTSTTNGNANVFSLLPASTAEDCQNIQILNCRLSSRWGTSNNGSVVRVAGKSTGLKVKNNAIGNSYGIYIQGQNTFAQYTTGIEIESNVFATMTQPISGYTSEVFEPVYMQYTTGAKIRLNKFTKTGCCADDLIQMYNSEDFEISYNRSDMTGGTYCITLSNCGINTTSFSQVYNNYLHFSYTGGTLIRIANSRYIKVMHNNMLHDGGGNATTRGIWVDNGTSGSNIQLVNNIISVPNGTPLSIDRVASVNELDHNAYYTPNNGVVGVINGVSYTDLASMKDKVFATSDNNSLVKDPLYVSAANLDAQASCFVGKSFGVTNDIYNQARSNPPSIGAKEIISTAINDIALEAFVSPLPPLVTGPQNLVVLVKNYGTNVVSNYNVGYTLNAGTPVVKAISTPLPQCQTATVTFSGADQPTLTAINFFNAYTDSPNGVNDTYKPNDSLKMGLCSPISGYYTIDAAGSGTNNFKSFTEAVDVLTCGGINGPIVFSVAAGTYTEQVTLPFIAGSSSTNTITFVGAGKASTILTYAATNANNSHTVRLNTAEWVTFRDMTIIGAGASYGWVFHFLNASNNKLVNCKVELTGAGASSTSTNYIAVLMNGSNSSYNASGNHYDNVVDSNEIYYGYFSIYSGNSVGTRTNYFRYNTLRDAYSAGAYFNSAQAVKFIFNNVSPRTSNASNDGVVLFNCNAASPAIHEIKNNIIRNAGNRGIYMATSTGSGTGNYGEIVNNLIGGGFRSTTPYGIYTTSSRWKYIHNTIFVDNPGTGNSRAFYQTTTGNTNDHINNLYVIDGINNASAIPVEIGATGGAGVMDFNNYYNYAGGTLITIGGLAYDATTFKAIFPNGGGEKSITEKPIFASPTDPHLASTYDAPSGDVSMGITIDVDGDVRCAGTATIGGDHTNFPQPVAAADFVVADTVYTESPTKIVNTTKGNPSKYTYKWFVDGLLESTDRDLQYGFNNTLTYNVLLEITGCSGSDTLSKWVTPVVPTTLPKSDFVADKQVVDVYAIVNLRDISLYGPNLWQWSASPTDNAFFSNDVAQNTSVFFGAPGFYDICLSTQNNNGPGKDTCKSSYIYVKEEYNMCASGSNISVGRFGKLYDDGGSGSNYGTNRNCTYLIDPCASSVKLVFSQFALGAGDALNIYDGTDATAPLIGTFTNATVGLPGGAAGLVANSGKMFIRWTSDASGVAAGFAAEWSSVADNTPAPVADFTFPTTIYTDEEVTFSSTVTTGNNIYSWDFDPPFGIPGNNGGDEMTDKYIYTSSGTYNVKHRVSNCAGSSYITKSVTVIDPVTAPVVDFEADKTLLPVMAQVTLTDKSTQGPTSFKWVISPSTGVTITPNATARNISATFLFPGTYTVRLVAANSIGADSTDKVGYLKVYDYCDPGVAHTDGKVGISNVTFGNINNTTVAGAAPYTNYLNTPQYATVIKGGIYPISISRVNIVDEMNRKVWIDWNLDGDFNDSLELVASEAAARTVTFNANIKIPVFAIEGFTRMRVGVSYGSDPNHPCGLNPVGEFEDYSVEVKADAIAPVITLTGLPKVNVEQWYQYIEPGFAANDDIDGNLTTAVSVSSTVDSTTVGMYEVKYEVTDVAGNKTTVVRQVEVTPDVTAPVITLIGNASISQTVKTAFTDPGATATDYFNRNFTSSIITTSNVDENKVGTYTIDYEVTDLSGNTAKVTRTVTMVDNIAPVITKTGDTVFVEVKNAYTEPGVGATDNYDASVNVIAGTVNTNATGTYTLTYTATDTAGNTATETRVVVVRDTQAPVVKVNGLDTMIIDVFSTYTELGAKVTDNYCTGLTADPSIVVNTNKLGDYLVSYTVTDCEGNAATPATRLVRVVDRVAPVLQLKGFVNTNKIMRWMPYTDSGVVYTDNYYTAAELAPNLKVTSNVNTLAEGIYEYCYDLTDPSGNVAQRVCRTVEVIANTTGITEGYLDNAVNVYPNPTHGQLNIAVKFEQHCEVKITVLNLLGETVAVVAPQTVAENNFSIDLSGFAAGLYMVRIETDGMAMVKKVNLVH